MVKIKKTTIIKIIIFTTLYALFCITILIFLKNIEYKTIQQEQEEESVLFILQNLKNPDQMLWYEDELLIKKGGMIDVFDIEKRTLKEFSQVGKNEILAIYKNKFVLIAFQNHTITRPEEKATDIFILNLEDREEIFSFSFHETIAPIYIENNFLYLIDNYTNSPERTYRVNLQEEVLEHYEIKEELILRGDEIIKIFDIENHLLMEIPKKNDITSFSVNDKLNKIALLDIKGNIWIYLKDPNH